MFVLKPVKLTTPLSCPNKLQATVLVADEFNRVIIPVKRGEENTDYVNASFIDVSDRWSPVLPASTPRGLPGTCSATLMGLLGG